MSVFYMRAGIEIGLGLALALALAVAASASRYVGWGLLDTAASWEFSPTLAEGMMAVVSEWRISVMNVWNSAAMAGISSLVFW